MANAGFAPKITAACRHSFHLSYAPAVLRPALEKTLPREYHRWSALLISYACRSLAVTIAWWCQRVIRCAG